MNKEQNLLNRQALTILGDIGKSLLLNETLKNTNERFVLFCQSDNAMIVRSPAFSKLELRCLSKISKVHVRGIKCVGFLGLHKLNPEAKQALIDSMKDTIKLGVAPNIVVDNISLTLEQFIKTK